MKNQYNKIAKHYNYLMGNRKKEIKFINELINKYYTKPKPKSVLELGIGNGEILGNILKDVKIKIGIDISEEMILIGKNKFKNIKFINSDIRNFRINHKFDVILCLFDTINHLPKLEDWSNVIKNAYNHLKKGGIFIFDFNTIERLNYLSSLKEYELNNNDIIGKIKVNNIIENKYSFNIIIYDNNLEKKSTIYEYGFLKEDIKVYTNCFSFVNELEVDNRVYLICIK